MRCCACDVEFPEQIRFDECFGNLIKMIYQFSTMSRVYYLTNEMEVSAHAHSLETSMSLFYRIRYKTVVMTRRVFFHFRIVHPGIENG